MCLGEGWSGDLPDPEVNGTAAVIPGAAPAAVVDASPVAVPSTDVQPSPRDTGETAPSVDPELSREQITRYFAAHPDEEEAYHASKSHDDLKKLPAYNAQLNRMLQIEKKKVEQQQAAEREHAQAYQRLDAYFAPLAPNANDPDQVRSDKALRLTEAIATLEGYRAYGQWQELRRTGGAPTATRAQVAIDMLQGLRGSLEAHPELSRVLDKWDDLTKEPDPAGFLFRIVEAALEPERNKLSARAKEEIKAGINEALIKRGLQADGPESPAGGVVSGNGLTHTLEQINAMTRYEREQLPPGTEAAALKAAMGGR